MTAPLLTDDICDYLERLPAVDRVNRRTGRIYYTKEFQIRCMRRYRKGDRPSVIFREAGIGSEIIGSKRIERCINRWKDNPDEKVKKTPHMFDQAPGAASRQRTKEMSRISRRISDLEDRMDRLEKERDTE